MEFLEKQPYEKFPIELDFSDSLDSGETLSTLSLVATDPDGNDVTSTVVSATTVDSQTCTAFIQSGSDSTWYKLEFKVLTSLSKSLEEEFILNVDEDKSDDRHSVTLYEMKNFLKLDIDDEDEEVIDLIASAEKHIKDWCGISLLNETKTFFLDTFPNVIEAPTAPLRSVTSITVATDYDYTETAVDSSYYKVFATDTIERGKIARVIGSTFPIAMVSTNAYKVTYVAGFGVTPKSVPRDLRTAVKLIVSHWYENRESQDIPSEALRLMRNYKVYNL